MKFLILAAMVFAVACGGSEAVEVPIEPTPVPPIEAPTEAPRPTPTLLPPTPQIIYIEVTPTPSAPLDEPLEEIPAQEEGEDAQPETEPEPVPTPTPKPTPKYRLAARSVADTSYKGLSFSSGPDISNDILTFSVVMDGQGNEPSQIQVYHSLREQDVDGVSSCTTDHPIAFVERGSTAGITEFQWEFCGSSGSKPTIYVDDIPWVAPSTWSYDLRKRRRIFDPYLYDWVVNVNLQGERVQELKYENGAGYILVVFSGETILTKVWIDG